MSVFLTCLIIENSLWIQEGWHEIKWKEVFLLVVAYVMWQGDRSGEVPGALTFGGLWESPEAVFGFWRIQRMENRGVPKVRDKLWGTNQGSMGAREGEHGTFIWTRRLCSQQVLDQTEGRA
jgi:hypothetical protein